MQSFQQKSESEITGGVFDASAALLTALSGYIAATFGDGLIKQRGTILTICDAVHDECHAIWEADKHGDYKVWKLAQLGKARYEALERRARSIIKFGTFEEAQKLKELKSCGIVASQEIS